MKKLYVLFFAVILGACAHTDNSVSSVQVPKGRHHVAERVQQSAIKHRVPIVIAKAVTHVESRFRCDAVGPMTKYGRAMGPLQIMPSSARAMFGYEGPTHLLANCETGLEYGMMHLARCFKLAGGDPRGTAHCHVQGPHRDPFRPVNAYARSYGNWVMAQYRGNPAQTRYMVATASPEGQLYGMVPSWTKTSVALAAASIR